MAYDLPADYVSQLLPLESGGDPNAKNPYSSASGQYQFTDPTFNDVLRNHPELAGADKNDPRVMAAFTKDNAASLQQSLGREPTKMDLYAAHFLGAAGATKFLTADPSTPATAVVSPQAIAGNQRVFLNPDGSPKTVGQVYASVAPHFGVSPDMTDANKPAWYAGNYTHSPGDQLGTQYAAAGNVATDATPAVPGLSSMFPSAQTAFGPIKQNISDYIKTQPAMWDKLAQMQAEFLKQTKQNPMDGLTDAMNALGQQNAAASALRNATAGGVLFNALPNPQPGIAALENAHQADVQQRTFKQNAAKTAYDLGSQNLLAQNAQGATNLGLQNTAEEAQLNYGLATGKVALELAKFNQEQAKAISDYIEKVVPNPETRAQITATFTQTANPTAPLSTNMKVVDAIVQKAQQGGLQISVKEPAQMFRIERFDPEHPDQPIVETVNAATPEGQAKLKNLPADTKVINLTTPGTNLTQTTNTGGGEGGGGGGRTQHTTSQIYGASVQTQQAAEAALKLLPYLEEAGGTGVITDSAVARQVQDAAKQLLGYDATNVPIRELFGKLMNQLQVAQVLPQIAMISRGTGQEFNKMLEGQIGPNFNANTIRAFLTHLRDTAVWEQGATTAVDRAAETAERNNNGYFKPDRERLHYMQEHPPPAWALDDLTKPQQPEQQSLADHVGSTAKPDNSTLGGQITNGFIDWGKRQLGIQPTTTAPQAPATPQQPNVLPGNPIQPPTTQDRKLFQ